MVGSHGPKDSQNPGAIGRKNDQEGITHMHRICGFREGTKRGGAGVSGNSFSTAESQGAYPSGEHRELKEAASWRPQREKAAVLRRESP